MDPDQTALVWVHIVLGDDEHGQILRGRVEPKAVSGNNIRKSVEITRSVPNYKCIFLDFVCGFGSYVKGLLKMKQCNLDAV